MDKFRLFTHAAIRIEGRYVLYFDPYNLSPLGEGPKDGDFVFSSHSHHDHFSPEDIRRVAGPNAVLIQPEVDRQLGEKIGFTGNRHVCMAPGGSFEAEGLRVTAIPSYTPGFVNHSRDKNFIGFIVEMDGCTYYIAGDTYDVPEARAVKADVAFVPVGGTYTMDAAEAASVINDIMPKVAVPTHYGHVIGGPADAEEFLSLLKPEIQGKIIMEWL